MDTKKEAAKLQMKIGALGVATVIKDTDGKFHVIPGHDFEVLGCYGEGLKRADLQEDLKYAMETKS